MHLPGRRQLLFATLYFCEGAPIGLLWWAMPAYWDSQGVPVDTVTLMAAVSVLPWSLKWLWAPLVDLTSARFSYRQWIIAAQLAMGLSLVPLAWLDPQQTFAALVTLLVLHAVTAATQDVAIDGMCIATIAEHERGQINGWMQAGMLLGRALFGGGALLLAARFTLFAAVAVLVAILWSVALVLAFWRPSTAADAPDSQTPEPAKAPPPPPAAPRAESGPRNASIPRWAFLKSRRVWLALAFALFGGAAYESTGALLGPFLGESGFTLADVGLFQLGPLAAAMAAGALVGGPIADRFGHVRVAFVGLLSLIGLNLLLGLSADAPLGPALIVAQYAAIGIFTASSYALFMDVASVGLKATLFSAYMGATNACESASALAAGRLAATLGFSSAFIMMTVPSLVGLAILPLLRKRA